jgi:hypothetical protein
MPKSVKPLEKVSIDDLHNYPTELDLQFDVKTNGEKQPKYSQKQIFEINKERVKKIKSMSVEERRELYVGKRKKDNEKYLASGKQNFVKYPEAI